MLNLLSPSIGWAENFIFLVFNIYLVAVVFDFILPYQRGWFFYHMLLGYGGRLSFHFFIHLAWIGLTLLSVIPYYHHLQGNHRCCSSLWWMLFLTRIMAEGLDMRLRTLDIMATQHNLPLLGIAFIARDVLILGPSYAAQYLQLTRPVR